MAKTHTTFRLSEESLAVIQQHQQRQGFIDRTEALEDILKQFFKVENKVTKRFRRFMMGDPIKPLEDFYGKENPTLQTQ